MIMISDRFKTIGHIGVNINAKKTKIINISKGLLKSKVFNLNDINISSQLITKKN